MATPLTEVAANGALHLLTDSRHLQKQIQFQADSFQRDGGSPSALQNL